MPFYRVSLKPGMNPHCYVERMICFVYASCEKDAYFKTGLLMPQFETFLPLNLSSDRLRILDKLEFEIFMFSQLRTYDFCFDTDEGAKKFIDQLWETELAMVPAFDCNTFKFLGKE